MQNTITRDGRGQLQVLNLQEKLACIPDHWSPRVVAEFNDHQLKLTKFEGEFIWHSHPEIDEVFLVIAGEFTMEFRDRSEHLRAGEVLVVPRGVEHKPIAAQECHVLLIEPRGTTNTGDAGGERTAPNDMWVEQCVGLGQAC